MCLKDYGKTNLMDSGSFWNGSIVYSYPNPMGSFNEDADRLREKFIPPRLEANQFEYLDPFFKETQSEISSKVLGFCYEFGLGTKKISMKPSDIIGSLRARTNTLLVII
ncbi:MAG: hypothetical protein HWD61_00565 [Parachlamydiaceae bacterium]|nr:MAG: hypothetical protein HWD61_00565 [Parachlamydiaceae bacterium]